MDTLMKRWECSVGHQCLVHDVYLQMCEGRRCFKICCQTLVLCRWNVTRGNAALPSLRSIFTQVSLRKQDQFYFSCWCIVHNIVRGRKAGSPSPPVPLQVQFSASGSLVTAAALPVSPLAAVEVEHLSWTYNPQHGQDTAGQGVLLALPQQLEMQHR